MRPLIASAPQQRIPGLQGTQQQSFRLAHFPGPPTVVIQIMQAFRILSAIKLPFSPPQRPGHPSPCAASHFAEEKTFLDLELGFVFLFRDLSIPYSCCYSCISEVAKRTAPRMFCHLQHAFFPLLFTNRRFPTISLTPHLPLRMEGDAPISMHERRRMSYYPGKRPRAFCFRLSGPSESWLLLDKL